MSAPPKERDGLAAPVTLADIAREAGTSRSTASRALSGRGYVSGAARDRLLAVADRLGYVPNASARTLKHRQSRVVGVVLSDLGNQFYARLAAGIEQVLREANYQMMVLGDNSEPDEASPATQSWSTTSVADGTRRCTSPASGTLASRCSASTRAGRATPAASRATGRGCATPGCRSTTTSSCASLRSRPTSSRGSRRSSTSTRRRRSSPPTTCSPSASGTCCAAAACESPDDFSLVGFDDVQWMAMVDPPITVVEQPTLELGRHAATLLLRRLEAPALAPAVEILQPRLVVRGSTGAPRH